MRKRRRRKPRPIATPPKYSTLTTREKATRERALNLLSDLRRGAGSYTQLLRKHHLDTRRARRYLGRNLIGERQGKRVRASNSDRLVRELLFPMPYGDVLILTRSSMDATKISHYFQDRDKLLRNKLSSTQFEAKWRGVKIGGRE